jgi:uncharacterized protein (DUF1697 family)
MHRYIALLRAINVGGHTVKMDQLKKLFVKMGFDKVETFIASGNVIFETDISDTELIKQKIETELNKSLGYKVPAFIRTTKELKDIADYKPFKESDLSQIGNLLYIAFLDNQPTKDLQKKISILSDKVNEFHFNKKEMYWLCRKNFSDSGISGKTLEKALGAEITVRNSTSIRKMIARFS